MPDEFSRTWIDFEDDLDAESMNDLEARMEQRDESSGFVSVDAHGATGDGIAADDAAFAAAVDALPDGGYLVLRKATYRLTEPWIIPTAGIRVFGNGRACTTLLIDHADGPGVWLQNTDITFSYLAVNASSARTAASAADNVGIMVMPVDEAAVSTTSPQPTRPFDMVDVASGGHPNHGIAIFSHGPLKTLRQCYAQSNGGHGFVVGNGVGEGLRTNLLAQVGGFVDMLGCVANSNAGHALAVGHPDDGSLSDTTDETGDTVARRIIRVSVHQADFGPNLTDSGLSYGSSVDNVWLRGTDLSIGDRSAVYGRIKAWGQGIAIRDTRFVGGGAGAFTAGGITAAVQVRTGVADGFDTEGVRVEELHPVGASCDPLVLVESDVAPEAVQVFQSGKTNVTSLITPGWGNVMGGPNGMQARSGFVSDDLTLTDDHAAYIAFTGAVAYGAVLIDSEEDTDLQMMVAFRTGDGSAFCRRNSNISANLSVATAALAGAPTGTTGTDTNFTVTALTDSNRLYMENRKGGTRTLHYTFLNLPSTRRAAPPVAV